MLFFLQGAQASGRSPFALAVGFPLVMVNPKVDALHISIKPAADHGPCLLLPECDLVFTWCLPGSWFRLFSRPGHPTITCDFHLLNTNGHLPSSEASYVCMRFLVSVTGAFGMLGSISSAGERQDHIFHPVGCAGLLSVLIPFLVSFQVPVFNRDIGLLASL